ncbi:MAG TPA: sigma-70 family RNA polymerase sigma factor [Candidatus Woesebacteria bacterium]|nr:sigma-70 family RNA polymerase sigma factor [Candidatus Woesebacteria bacterium]
MVSENTSIDKATLNRLKQYIAKRVRQPEEAEEIFQDVLVDTVDSLPLFRGESALFTFICGIANHTIVDYYRKKKLKTLLFSRFPFLEEVASQALGPDEKLEKEELRKEVKIVLAALSEGYREVLRLKYIDGMTVNQIAKKFNTSFKSVESKLSRARSSFRKIWLIGKSKFKI